MNALDLGPAIFGVGEMIGQASRILYNDSTRVKVEVRADLEHASFGIEFIAVSASGIGGLTWEQLAAITVLLGFGGKAVENTFKGVKNVAGLLRWQRGRAIDQTERVEDDVRLTINDESVNVPVTVYNIFINPEVRKGFKALVDPMENEGVDSVSIQAEDAAPEKIERFERSSFQEPPLPERLLGVFRSMAILEIVSISFREGHKWRFAQGGNDFFAEILDHQYLRTMRTQHEQFAAGDALVVEMEIETKREGSSLRYERRITKVFQHIHNEAGGDQLPLPMPE